MSDNIRKDFPIFQNRPDLVWLDNSSTTQKPECLTKALTDFYANNCSNVYRGEYPMQNTVTRLYEESRAKAAKWFNVSTERLAFTLNATDSLNMAADILSKDLREGANVVATVLEHNSALLPFMKNCRECGAEIRYIGVLEDGTLDFDSIENAVDSNTKAAVVTAASNVSGYATPLDRICGFFRQKSIPLVIDATQLAPHGTIDAAGLDFEYMCISAHKMYGPMGVGLLISGNDEALNKTARLGGGTVEIASRTGYVKKNDHEGMEAGTPDAAGIIAFGEVLDYLSSLDLDILWKKESELASAIREQLAKLDVRMVPGGDSPLPVISFDPVFMHPTDLARLLGSMGVCVRSGKHCAHLIHDELGFDTTLRVSLGLYNTEEDAEKLIESLVYLKGRYGRVR